LCFFLGGGGGGGWGCVFVWWVGGGGGAGGGPPQRSKKRRKRVRDMRVAYRINPHTLHVTSLNTLHTTTIPPTANSTARFTAHYIQHTTYNAPAPAPLASARAPTRRRGGPRRRRPNRDTWRRSWREVSQWMGRRGRRTRWWKEGWWWVGGDALLATMDGSRLPLRGPLTTRPTLSPSLEGRDSRTRTLAHSAQPLTGRAGAEQRAR